MQGQKIQASKVYQDIENNLDKKGICLEGGSRSTKSWSILQWLVVYCQNNQNKGKEITIGRDRLTWLKLTVFRDFETILKTYKFWNERNYHKQEMTYELFGNRFTFIGFDEPAKLHGLTQNIFWINEGIGTPGSAFNPTKEIFDQLEMRTTERFFIDYNPKVTKHWIYDSVLTRTDVEMLHSTQLDNPFLPDTIRKKILGYEPTPDNIRQGTSDITKWFIYGLGKRANHEGTIYTNVNYVKEFPADCSKMWYGLDFGYSNDVTALVKVGLKGGELFMQGLIYETGLTNQDISAKMNGLGINKRAEIIADSAEQKSIEEIRRLGWVGIEPANKGSDSILNGIDIVKRYRLNALESCIELKDELDNYTWKQDAHTAEYLNVPVDRYNHYCDGFRYVALNKLQVSKPAPRKMKIGF